MADAIGWTLFGVAVTVVLIFSCICLDAIVTYRGLEELKRRDNYDYRVREEWKNEWEGR